jgi:hypothetical protein
VKDYKEYMEGVDLSCIFAKNVSAMINHGFTQINNSTTGIKSMTKTTSDGIDTYDFEKGSINLQCTGMTITSLKSNMFGFNVNSAALNKIASIFSTPQIIPSQQLDYNAFPIAATAAGIQSTINMPVSNTTCISIMFPKHDNDYTVFENPVYNNLQLTINGRNIPDEVVSSQGARFLQQQLVASDLAGGLECTKEFENSIVMVKNNESGDRYNNSLSDSTSFMWNVQCERNNAGYTFDGIDSNGQNIPIQIKGQPIYTGDNDTYYIYDKDNKDFHPPPPQIWCCRDTYFLASSQGLKYYAFGTPSGK